jgi:hypothetical protein
VVILTETWLDDLVKTGQVAYTFDGFEVASRQDRPNEFRFDKRLNVLVPKRSKNNTHGGGTMILVKRGLSHHSPDY